MEVFHTSWTVSQGECHATSQSRESPSLLLSERRSRSRPDRRKLRHWSLIRLVVERQRFRHVFAQPLDSGFMSRMGGEKLLRLLAS
jgi:hypothetical protein